MHARSVDPLPGLAVLVISGYADVEGLAPRSRPIDQAVQTRRSRSRYRGLETYDKIAARPWRGGDGRPHTRVRQVGHRGTILVIDHDDFGLSATVARVGEMPRTALCTLRSGRAPADGDRGKLPV